MQNLVILYESIIFNQIYESCLMLKYPTKHGAVSTRWQAVFCSSDSLEWWLLCSEKPGFLLKKKNSYLQKPPWWSSLGSLLISAITIWRIQPDLLPKKGSVLFPLHHQTAAWCSTESEILSDFLVPRDAGVEGEAGIISSMSSGCSTHPLLLRLLQIHRM